MHTATAGVTGCVLAGGLGRRFGGVDKGLVTLASRPLVAHVVARFAPQVEHLLISANRHHAHYRAHATTVLGDRDAEAAGPLAGIAVALAASTTPLLAVVPCDAPFLPLDLVARLRAALARERGEIAVARTADGLQPTFALLRVELAPTLDAYLAGGERKAEGWLRRHALVEVDFDARFGEFHNVNTPEELAAATRRLAGP